MPASYIETLLQRHKQGIFYLAIVLTFTLGTLLRFFEIGSFGFWDDELFSVSSVIRSGPWDGPLILGRSMSELQIADSFWTWKLADPHPPMYEMLLVPWISIWGESEFAVRSLSAIFGMITLLSVLALPQTISKLTKIIYLLLLATSGCLIIYSQDARNYALSACLTSWMYACLINQIENNPRSLAEGKPSVPLLALGSLLSLTHYYGSVFVCCVAAFTVLPTLRKFNTRAFIHVVTRWFVALIPTLVYVALGWVGIMTKLNAAPPTALSLAMTFKRNILAFTRNFIPGHIEMIHFWIMTFLMIAFYFCYKKMRQQEDALYKVAGYLFGINTLFFVLQVFGTRRAEFIHERYMIFIVPGYLLLIAIFTQSTNWIKYLSRISIPLIAISGIMVWHSSPKPQGWGEWKLASAAASKLYKPGDIILMPITHQPILQAYFQHYLKDYIPLAKQEEITLDLFNSENTINYLHNHPAESKHLVIFSHYAFEPQTNLTINRLTEEENCIAKPLQHYGTLRVTDLFCSQQQ